MVSHATVRRLYADHGLDRIPAREGSGQKTRLRWEAESPGALWHADVCYGPALTINGQSRPLRIHALLDDASRYVVAIEARHRAALAVRVDSARTQTAAHSVAPTGGAP